MNEPFVEMLRGDTNTLGRTDEVVAVVLDAPDRVAEVYELFFQPDVWVRLRASSVTKRLWRAHPNWITPYIDGWIRDVSTIGQPSADWTFAQMCLELEHHLTAEQKKLATVRVKEYIESSDDWIVQNSSISTLTHWAIDDSDLGGWLKPHLVELTKSSRKSVASRASKALTTLG